MADDILQAMMLRSFGGQGRLPRNTTTPRTAGRRAFGKGKPEDSRAMRRSAPFRLRGARRGGAPRRCGLRACEFFE